ncbi:MAG: PLP-dependent aminotransferase family protein [Spongiibacteraceae bacterium]|nr:PLP-dependent aminotransferase family protein [Spongiibacteraceae bacterium]MBN4055638.1 PLP-dependent aminotransferase family protein [bacterium AH-315-K03]
MTLYQTLADKLINQIRNGTYQVGDRIPSLRKMAAQNKVSIATVLEAYNLVEQQQLIKTKPQSGYYVFHNPRLLLPPPESENKQPTQLHLGNSIVEILSNTQNAGLFHFGLAIPHKELQPQQHLARIASTLSRQHPQKVSSATFPPGDSTLRRQIAQKMSKTACLVHPDDIVITNGCQEAILLSLQILTQPGDIVAIESPCYHGFLLALESLGLKALSIATHSEKGIDIEALEEATKKWPIKACLCSPTLSNPSGASMSLANKKALLKLAKQKNFTIIEDDIFGDLHFEQKRPAPLLSLDNNNQVIYCSSASKSIAPGLRIGWVIAKNRQRQFIERQMASTTGTNTLSQKILAKYFSSPHYEKHLKKIRAIYQQNQQRVLHTVFNTFPPSTYATQARGGFIAWIALPKSVDTYTLYQHALKEKISIVPGKLFAHAGFNHCLRLSYARSWSATMEKNLSRLGEIATRLASQQTR